jgi:enolase
MQKLGTIADIFFSVDIVRKKNYKIIFSHRERLFRIRR